MINQEQQRQAIYDILEPELRKYEVFDPKHLERICVAIQSRLSELQPEPKPVNNTDNSVIELIKRTLERYEQDAKASVNPVIYQMYFDTVAREIASDLVSKDEIDLFNQWFAFKGGFYRKDVGYSMEPFHKWYTFSEVYEQFKASKK